MLRESKKTGRGRSGPVAVQVGANVRRLRQAQGLTSGDLARSAGISAAMLSRLETGDVSPSLETLAALADALGIAMASLLKEDAAQQSDAQFNQALDQSIGSIYKASIT